MISRSLPTAVLCTTGLLRLGIQVPIAKEYPADVKGLPGIHVGSSNCSIQIIPDRRSIILLLDLNHDRAVLFRLLG